MVVHWLDIGMVRGSNLGSFTLNFIFARISFGMNMKSQIFLAAKGGLENHHLL